MSEFYGFKCDGCGMIRKRIKKKGALENLVPEEQKGDVGPWLDAEISVVGDEGTLLEGDFCGLVCLVKKLNEEAEK